MYIYVLYIYVLYIYVLYSTCTYCTVSSDKGFRWPGRGRAEGSARPVTHAIAMTAAKVMSR